METTTQNRFAVVQDVYALENWQAAADLLTEVLGLPIVSARQQAKKSHGFLATDLPEPLAQRLRDACIAKGIAVQLVPQSEVVPKIKPARTHRIWIAEEALRVQSAQLEAGTSLPWDTLRLIAVTKTTKKESFQHWETTGGKRGDEVLKVTAYTEDVAVYQADVFAFLSNREVIGLRLISRELNYAEALGEMAPDPLVDANARTNGFRLLLSSLAAHASRIYIPPETWAFLKTGGTLTPPLPSPDDFDFINRWLLQRLRLRDAVDSNR